MKQLRRFCVVLALLVWQGGFTFYGAVVVPIARSRLASRDSSAVTQEVTEWLNLIGVAAAVVMFCDLWAGGRTARVSRWLLWLAMVAPLPLLFILHGELSRQMMDPTFLQTGITGFRPWHKAYLWLSTIQWLAGLGWIYQTLRAWNAESAASANFSVTQPRT